MEQKNKVKSKIQNRRNMKLFDEIHLLTQIQEETILFYFILSIFFYLFIEKHFISFLI